MNENIFKIYYNPYLKDNINSKFLRRNKKLIINSCKIYYDIKNWNYCFTQIFESNTKKGGKSMCNNIIEKGFFNKESVNDNTSVIFLIESKLDSRKGSYHMVGFSLCNDLNLTGEGNGIYLDAICARPRYGSILLDFIELSSLAYVINYYRKKGYRHIKNCQTKEGEGYRENQISRSAELNSYKKFKKDEDIIEWEEDNNKIIRNSIQEKDSGFVDFLKLLSSRGYGVNCSEYKDRPSSSRTYAFLNKKCMDEGFTMIKCFKKRNYTKKKNINKIKKTKKKI